MRVNLCAVATLSAVTAFAGGAIAQQAVRFGCIYKPRNPVDASIRQLWVEVEEVGNSRGKPGNGATAAQRDGQGRTESVSLWADGLCSKIGELVKDGRKDMTVLYRGAALDLFRREVESIVGSNGGDLGKFLAEKLPGDACLLVKLEVSGAEWVEAPRNLMDRVKVSETKVRRPYVLCSARFNGLNGAVLGGYADTLECFDVQEQGVVGGTSQATLDGSSTLFSLLVERHAKRIVAQMVGWSGEWTIPMPNASGAAIDAAEHVELGEFGKAMRIAVLRWQETILPGSADFPDFNAATVGMVAYAGLGQFEEAMKLNSAATSVAESLGMRGLQCDDVAWLIRKDVAVEEVKIVPLSQVHPSSGASSSQR